MTRIDNDKSTINTFCSYEQLKKFIGKICIWNFTFMHSAITGKLIEVTNDYMLIEMRDGRTMCAKLACINGFAMTKKQRVVAV